MNKDDLIALAKSVAGTFNLPPSLMCAVCEQESGWNPQATRYEPAFRERYVDRLGYPEDESRDRSTSWGLMQIMGQVAREQGYNGPFEQLLIPEVGLAWGCRYFETRMAHAGDNVGTALLLWNGGGNKEYPQQVLARVERYGGPSQETAT